MILVPGGVTTIGSADGLDWERPVLTVEVKPFYLDVHPVTVAQFRTFVEATGYVTQAEEFGNAGVFNFLTGEWTLVDGADWEHPFGPDQPAAADDHPVTQVSWHDAVAYCRWAGKRLPTEFEWEHAARNARNDPGPYAWGEALVDAAGTYHANTWQGEFPQTNTEADGFRATNPVGAFGSTPLGLSDMGGNVWEWCADWFRPYDDFGTPFEPGPDAERAHRGGSFLCDPDVCHGYRVSARAGTTPDTSLCHLGFRCAKDATEP